MVMWGAAVEAVAAWAMVAVATETGRRVGRVEEGRRVGVDVEEERREGGVAEAAGWVNAE